MDYSGHSEEESMSAETWAAVIFGMLLAVAMFFPAIAWLFQRLLWRLGNG